MIPSVRQALRAAWTRAKLYSCAAVGPDVVARGHIWVYGPGLVRIGARVRLDGLSAPIELHAGPCAQIVIEDDARIASGASIEAENMVRIGRGSSVGRFCKIIDNHFHRTTTHDAKPESVPVIVEENVSLGPRAILLPGAHIGQGSVVGAATVVTRRVPPGVLIAGQPATVRRLS